MIMPNFRCSKNSLLCFAAAVLVFASGCEKNESKTKSSSGHAVSDTVATADELSDNIFIDTRDGKKYKYVKISGQIWMAENLNYNAGSSKCREDLESFCIKYGREYDFATAMGLPDSCNTSVCTSQNVKYRGVCPDGWHIPNRAEWDKLFRYADGTSGTQDFYPYRSDSSGNYLKATGGWTGGIWWSTEEYNKDYFRAFCSDDPILQLECAPEPGMRDSDFAYYRSIRDGMDGEAYWHNIEKNKMISVRCIKD